MIPTPPSSLINEAIITVAIVSTYTYYVIHPVVNSHAQPPIKFFSEESVPVEQTLDTILQELDTIYPSTPDILSNFAPLRTSPPTEVSEAKHVADISDLFDQIFKPSPSEDPLYIYTDASVGHYRKLVGLAAVIAQENHETKFKTQTTEVSTKGSTTLPELCAIHLGLKEAAAKKDKIKEIIVYSDSQNAIQILNKTRQLSTIEYHTLKEVTKIFSYLDSTLAKTKVSFRWVKGHAGNPFNEASDRLALAARRSTELTQEQQSTHISQIISQILPTLPSTPF